MSASLADLMVRCRQRANFEKLDEGDGGFIEDNELRTYIRDSYRELYDLLVTTYQDYFVEDPFEFTIASGNTQVVETDFYKIIGVDVLLNGDEWYEIRPFNFIDRNVQLNGTRFLAFGVYATYRYRVMGQKIRITPTDSAAGQTYRYWYIPNAPALTLDADTIDVDSDRWSVYIETDVAIKMLAKEESDVTVFAAQKQELKTRIREAAVNRDAGYAEQITDVRGGRNLGYGLGFGRG